MLRTTHIGPIWDCLLQGGRVTDIFSSSYMHTCHVRSDF